ncbi:MAG TPA: ABC transporter substrate-binding protein [Candidatus Eisenbacteria bacterium]|nr:ABC transporter substrate-binding protein [Candidatus Eisenbacteria bacterium]
MRRAMSWICLLAVVLASAAGCLDELRFYLRSDPKTFNPALVDDDAAETIRYLTGGVLLRLNRQTQQVEPELATAWKVSKDGRTISFQLRKGVRFSDGTPFGAQDVKFTMDALMDPALHSPTGDALRTGAGKVTAVVQGVDRISLTFPAPVAGLERLFDQVAIVSASSAKKEMAVLGPFYVTDYKPGAYVALRRNPNYWKHDEAGHSLPYLDAVKLEIQGNRDIEMLKFSRSEIHLINGMDADYYDRLSRSAPGKVRDAGPSLDSEQMWFNQVATAPIAPYKLDWFRSRNFRRAVSAAINRDDLCKVVYGGHAIPARGPVSPANKYWFNTQLPQARYDPANAMQLLREDGFRLAGGKLLDRSGHLVEFSLVTNAGNRMRERTATMIQADLRSIGITVNIVTLDFPSLIQRISESFNYEAAMLGLTNVELDPNGQMNVWLSSSDEHQWNPRQKTPATAWEAELDRLMRAQASAIEATARKRDFDRVQAIVAEEAPFIYLVNKNTLVGVSPLLEGVVPVSTRPQTYWNIERIRFAAERASNGK